VTADGYTQSADLAAAAAERPRNGGALRQFWQRISLQPYGDALRTPGAAFWIFCARVAIFVMAAAEAVSWSYLGYYIGQSSLPYATAAVTGLAIFSVIWIVDASFITLDTARSRDEAAILGRVSDGRSDRLRLAGGLLIRAAIISATLFISAPFLAQLVFYRDINAEMGRRDAALVAQKRAELAASFDARAAALQAERRELDAASIREAAGAGPSGRMGRGPAVATIERRLADLDVRQAGVASERQTALARFDALDRDALRQQYGLELTGDGIRERGRILDALSADDAYANAELAIRAFLAFLFLALIVLKLFQPASVSVYYSELLQDLGAQYRAGAFDAWLPPEERSYARVGLTPLRFRAWCADNYRSVRADEEKERRLTHALALRNARASELRELRRATEAELQPLRSACAAEKEAIAALHDELRTVEGERSAMESELAARERALGSLASTMRGGIEGDAFLRAADAQSAVEREASALRESLRANDARRAALDRRMRSHDGQLETMGQRLAGREALLEKLDDELARLTLDTSAAIASGAPRTTAADA
jgi:hypothetical protein